MTNDEALKAWEKFYAEIDKENWLFVGTINPEMVSLAIKALKERPQVELANKVWRLYKKYQPHLATRVIEFGDELKELLIKYMKGGAEE